jgi:hypothetical protein
MNWQEVCMALIAAIGSAYAVKNSRRVAVLENEHTHCREAHQNCEKKVAALEARLDVYIQAKLLEPQVHKCN